MKNFFERSLCSNKKMFIFLLLILGLTVFTSGKIDPTAFKEMKPRCIGPAAMSGRISDIDTVITNPDIIYVATATGGAWKSDDGGVMWKPIFDEQSTSSTGAVAICQQNPNIVWVGTGEGNPRNSSGVGRGVFKTLDAGKTWQLMGLEKTEKISRLRLHPSDPNIAYAAALGTTWGENPERGVFKTTDGGKTWQKILFVDNKTGAADLAMDPHNPNKLIAAMWEHRRWPWFFTSGGSGSGLYITTDGGTNWKKLTADDGLPAGELGRIGVAFAQNKPSIVYALVEAKKSVLLRSTDGGFTWETVNSEKNMNDRPFYYADIRVNPVNENIVYSLQSPFKVSEDGGKTFRSLVSFRQVHGDFHALWLHPDGERMIVGSDGGIAISHNRGKSWRYVANLPLAQFYHISYDMQFPYNVYGGLQDNGSWKGPSRVVTDMELYNFYWRIVGFGDGFDTEPDPENSDCGYGMSQGGWLFYFNSKTGINKDIRPTESDVKHRYNWNAGLAIDPFVPSTIYYGSQFVHRSKDKGRSWEIISPDLTTNDPEKQKLLSGGLTIDVSYAESHTTIISIAPSPVKQGVIWVGTDDGNVQLTRDNGKSWELVSASLTGSGAKNKKFGPVPACTWVPYIEASPHDASSAFVVFDNHRRADWTPYVFVTHDNGKTWRSLVTPGIDGFLHVIRQDPVDKDLLFLGGEFGLFVSFNGGKEWMKWTAGLPVVPIHDMGIHPREHDLIIGTHGRAAYILDDISPLREIDENLLKKDLYLFPVMDSYQYYSGWASANLCPGDSEFQGENRRYGTYITYLYNPPEEKPANAKTTAQDKKETAAADKAKEEKKEKKLRIEILDTTGKVIRRLKAETKKGLNRITWDMCSKSYYQEMSDKEEDYDWSGSDVLPGTYTVRLSHGERVETRPIRVLPDPRFQLDMALLEKNQQYENEVGGWIEILLKAEKRIKATRETLQKILDQASKNAAGSREKDGQEDAGKKQLKEKTDALDKQLKSLLIKISGDPDMQGFNDDADTLDYQLSAAKAATSPFEPVSQTGQVKYEKVKKLFGQFLVEYNSIFEKDVTGYQKFLEETGFSFFPPVESLNMNNK